MPTGDIVLQSDFARLTLGHDGRVHGFARRDGANLLAAAGGCPLMLVRIGGQWHESNSLAATEQAGKKRLRSSALPARRLLPRRPSGHTDPISKWR